MLKTINKHKLDILSTLCLVIVFAFVRIYESKIFYDPFLRYFKHDYMYESYPEYNSFLLYINLVFRYALNSIISLAILFILFRKKTFLKIALLLYSVALLILLAGFAITVNFISHEHYQYLFYIRRFLIQPLLLLLFIPAFYYQKKYT